MAGSTLTKTRIHAGVWEGVLTGMGATPPIAVTHQERKLDGVSLIPHGDTGEAFVLRVPIPADVLCDGVQSFVITDEQTGEVLDRFTIITGEPADGDLRSELELLRAELDMLKKAFRRHCVETM